MVKNMEKICTYFLPNCETKPCLICNKKNLSKFYSIITHTHKVRIDKFSLASGRYGRHGPRWLAAESDYCLDRRSENAIIPRLASPRARRSSTVLTAIRVTLVKLASARRFCQQSNNADASEESTDNFARAKHHIDLINQYD